MSGDEANADPLAIFEQLETFRETMRGLVAMWRQDGFTEQQARELAVAQIVSSLRSSS